MKYTITMRREEHYSGDIEADSADEAIEKAERMWDEDPEAWGAAFDEPVDDSQYDPMPDVVSVSRVDDDGGTP